MLHIEQEEEEELQEADILWPDAAQVLELPQLYFSHADADEDDEYYSGEHRQPMKLQIQQKASSPIDIPRRKVSAIGAKGAKAQAGFCSKLGASHAAGFGSGGSVIVGSHVFVPPHVIVDRRAKRDKAVMMFVVPNGRARARKMLD